MSELPVERSTLLLRLLGAGRVLRQAVGELKALPEDAPERTLALPVLLRLRVEVEKSPVRTSDDQEFFMDTQDIVDKWRNEVKREAAEGALSRAVIRLYEARFGAMSADLRKLIEDTHDERTLDDWNVLAGTGSAEDLAAAVRASRAS